MRKIIVNAVLADKMRDADESAYRKVPRFSKAALKTIPKKYWSVADEIYHNIIMMNTEFKHRKKWIWTANSITGEELAHLLGCGESSAKVYSKKLTDLVDNNVLHKIVFNYTKHKQYICFYSIEIKTASWKYTNQDGVITPESAIRIADSVDEVVAKICSKCNENFDSDIAEKALALYLCNDLMPKMATEISNLGIVYGRDISFNSMKPREYVELFKSSMSKFDPDFGISDKKIMLNVSEESLPFVKAEAKKLGMDMEILDKEVNKENSFVSYKVNQGVPENGYGVNESQGLFFDQSIDSPTTKKMVGGAFPTTKKLVGGDTSGYQNIGSRSDVEKCISDVKSDRLHKEDTPSRDIYIRDITNIDTVKTNFQSENLLKEIVPNEKKANIGVTKKRGPYLKTRYASFWEDAKEIDLLKSVDLVRFFHRTISEKFFKNKEYNKNYTDISERSAANNIFDVLYKNNCRNKETVLGWINWYMNYLQFGNLKRRFTGKDLSLHAMESTWSKYKAVMPKDFKSKPISKASKAHEENNGNAIYDDLSSIMNSTESKDKRLLFGLSNYGIVLVSKFLSDSLHVKEDKLVSGITKFITSENISTKYIRKIYSSTEKFDCDFVQKEKPLFYGWKETFKQVWEKNDCIGKQSEYGSNSDLTVGFFDFMARNKEVKK